MVAPSQLADWENFYVIVGSSAGALTGLQFVVIALIADARAARSMLERAAEGGNARALFALAETYDSNMLSAWGTVGMQGDTAKARELYGKALAGGVEEANARLKALQP